MTTVVCTFTNCPNRSGSGFCKRDTVILEANPQGFMQCKTGLIDMYERSVQNDVQRTTQGQETGNQECENNES